MKRLQITDQELTDTLRRMAPETGSLLCMGCGHERGCSIHGCSVLRAAADRVAELSGPPPNPPLTLEELREMDGDVMNCESCQWYDEEAVACGNPNSPAYEAQVDKGDTCAGWEARPF